MLTDAELLRRYVDDKSEPAFTELVDRHLDLVYSAALRQLDGDAHRARDVAQLVFTTLARKAASLVPHPVLTGWLYTTTRFTADKLRRADWRRQVREKEAHAMQETLRSASPDPAVNWEQVRPQLDAAMGELNERDREAVLLRFFARQPFAEIGAALQLSEDAARMRVERALEKLRILLTHRGITSTSAALATCLAAQAVGAAPSGLAASISGAALAGAPAASGFIGFMSTGKLATVVIAVVACVSLGTLVQQSRTNRAMQDEWATANSAVESRRAAIRALVQRTTEEEKQVAALQERTAATRAELEAAARLSQTAPSGGDNAAQNPVEVGNAFLAAHPAVKQALVERSRARVAARFQPMYARLGLTREQIDQFESLMIENEGISTGDDNGSMILRPGTGMSRTDVDAALRAMLGENGYEVYRETGSTSGLKSLTTRLAANLYFTDTPLTPAQADELVQLMGDGKGPHGFDALIERGGGVLSPPQIEALRGMQVEEDFNRAMSEGIKRWMTEAVNAAGVPKKVGGK